MFQRYRNCALNPMIFYQWHSIFYLFNHLWTSKNDTLPLTPSLINLFNRPSTPNNDTLPITPSLIDQRSTLEKFVRTCLRYQERNLKMGIVGGRTGVKTKIAQWRGRLYTFLMGSRYHRLNIMEIFIIILNLKMLVQHSEWMVCLKKILRLQVHESLQITDTSRDIFIFGYYFSYIYIIIFESLI